MHRIWATKKFVEVFNFVDVHGLDVADYLSWNAMKMEIMENADTSSEYPKLIKFTMDARYNNGYYLYEAKYKEEIKRITCAKYYPYWYHIPYQDMNFQHTKSLGFILKTVKAVFGIKESIDEIDILVDDASIADADNVHKLFDDNHFVQCVVAIKR